MDNIHVTQTPIKQKEPYLNSFNLKSLDNTEKGGGGHHDHGQSGSGLSVPVIIFLGILTVVGIFVLIACLISSIHR